MKKVNLSLPIILLLFFAVPYAFSAESAQNIITRSDAVRNPAEPFQVGLRLTEYVNGAARNEVILRVYSKIDQGTGQYKNLVRYLEPPRDAGKAVLMSGTTMWFYDPASRTSVRISPQQRLIGQAAEGDVVTVNFARDYQAKLVGPPEGEMLNDADRKPRKCWHLELTPSNDSAIYGRAEYWVEKDSYRPVKGKFYSDSGRLLKIAYYHNFEEQLGAQRPAEIILIDGVNPKLVTTMNLSGYKAKKIPDSWYQREFLPRLKGE
ncbi:outer membrane lipoprotein-sorting protein [Geomonas sp. RF6]|uniref:outer membrane lipoprotein-sorting protein n=1 Tax=Geomonas sp. RF6 TaxID=2897342 RepID=UPI001E30D6E4|nr:outer membrane lipoprotein-sorting protein [Geomonas sp. RF6]UFS70633.1 outer membrane lipoprotein-sorting protein [Geomonas sp. RF6]